MQNLTTRVLSALVAVFTLFAVVYFFKLTGLIIFSSLVVIVGIYEMSRLLFSKTGLEDKDIKIEKNYFFSWAVLIFLSLVFSKYQKYGYEILIVIFVIVSLRTIINHKKFNSIDQIFSYISKFMVGIFYSTVLPALIINILKIENTGIYWFLFLLATVFAGDIGAYIFGSLFGKTKLAPLLSPKKSLEGSLGGLLFSGLIGLIFSYLILGHPVYIMVGLGFFGGLFGQVGDFFESLLKRLAGVKDSGSIMPGHGGVLDRLDGVYFASPLFYIVINYII